VLDGADTLAGETGLSLNLDFSIRLLKIRTGLWNPPLFLQDVYVVPFAGLALTDALDRQFAGGLELHWELKALAMQSGWPLDLFVSLAVDGAGTPSVALGLAPVGWEWLARSGPRRN